MSMELMVLVNKHKFDSPVQKLIFLQLADNANKNGKCWPSYQYIAEVSGCGKSTVRKHLKVLEKKGYLSIKNRKGKKGNSSNYYQINKLKLTAPPVAPDSTGGCYEVAQGVAPDSTPPVAPGSTRTSHYIEPVNEPKENKQKKSDLIFRKITLKNLGEISETTAKEFVDHRVNLKKPLTQKAFDRAIRFAHTVADRLDGILSPDEVVQKTIDFGWQGVGEPEWFRKRLEKNNTKGVTSFEREEQQFKDHLRRREQLVGDYEPEVSPPLGRTDGVKLL